MSQTEHAGFHPLKTTDLETFREEEKLEKIKVTRAGGRVRIGLPRQSWGFYLPTKVPFKKSVHINFRRQEW